MVIFETLLLLVAFCVALAWLAQRSNLPLAVPLVLGGMALAFVPGLPAVELNPELALALFLPPLLQASAYRTDWAGFRSNLRPILLMAVGAVFFSALVVALVARLMVPGLPWWAAVALGAIVAPPDAVAASSVLERFELPRRIVIVLKGESLINDASSLVLYRFAVAAVAAGSVSYAHGALQFVGAASGGALVGWLVGRAAMVAFARLDDTMLDIALSLLAGFVAYLAAERLHASGVLAAVACGCVLGRRQHAQFSARTRLDQHAVWSFIEFLLTSLVFMLIGLQLRGIVARLTDYDWAQLAWLGAAVALTLIASRFVWVFASTWVARRRPASSADSKEVPRWSHATVLSWAGMRGVVSLAAALALPLGFPARDIIVFLAFCSIFATLVVQGTTLGWLVQRVGAAGQEDASAGIDPTTAQARAELASAARDAVKSLLHAANASGMADAAAQLIGEYEARAERASLVEQAPESRSDELDAQRRVRLIALQAARDKLAQQSDALDLETQRVLGEELDLEEQQIRRARDEL